MSDERASDDQRAAAAPADKNVTMSLGDAIAFGFSLHRKGDLESAEAVYRQILEAKPDQVETLNFLGVLLHQIGKSDDGAKMIIAALQTNPTYIDAISN